MLIRFRHTNLHLVSVVKGPPPFARAAFASYALGLIVFELAKAHMALAALQAA